MPGSRILAVVLLAVALAGLAASKAFPFLDDVPTALKAAIAAVGAACGLIGVWLWLRSTPSKN